MFKPQDCAPNAPSAFTEYSEILRRNMAPAIVNPLVDSHRTGPGSEAGPYIGRVGVFSTLPAIMTPTGQWSPNYMGIVPVSAQQQIVAPEPWLDTQG